jgi:hypothetical protein
MYNNKIAERLSVGELVFVTIIGLGMYLNSPVIAYTGFGILGYIIWRNSN